MREVQGKFLGVPDIEVRAYEVDLVHTPNWQCLPSPIPLNPPVVSDAKGGFTLTLPPPNPEKSRDVVAKAFVQGPGGAEQVLAVSPTFFNLAVFETSLELILPPVGIVPPDLQPAGTPIEFSRIQDAVSEAMRPVKKSIDNLADDFDSIQRHERDKIIEHLTGDALVAWNRPVRPDLSRPDFQTASMRYKNEVQQLMLTESVKVENVIRAHGLVTQFQQAIAGQPGFELNLRLANDQILPLIIDQTSSSSITAEVIYALMPTVRMDLRYDALFRMLVTMSGSAQRKALEDAIGDRRISEIDVDAVLVALAELRNGLSKKPEWEVEAEELSKTQQELIAKWLGEDEPRIDLFDSAPDRDAAQTELEWIGLTLNVPGLRKALKEKLKPSSGPFKGKGMVAGLGEFEDTEIREVVKNFASSNSGLDWPSTFRGDNPASIAGKAVEFIRIFIPFAPTASEEDQALFDLCLKRRRVVGQLKKLKHDGNTQVSEPAHLRTVLDGASDASQEPPTTLFGALNAAAKDEAWKSWPSAVRSEQKEDSVMLFFRHIRDQQPSAETALENFFAENPAFRFSDDEPSTWKEIQPSDDRVRQACRESGERAPLSKKVAHRLNVLQALWWLTEGSANTPKLRIEAIEWIVAQVADKLNPQSGDVVDDLKAKVKELGNLSPPDPIKEAVNMAIAKAKGQSPTSPGQGDEEPDQIFVNHEEHLVDCRPPIHRDPLGPAAYLADLYEFLRPEDDEKDDEKTDWEKAFDKQRPDVPRLELSKANVTVPVLEVDLINELLEAHAEGGAPGARQTGKSDHEALRIVPEYAGPGGDFNPWRRLRSARSPFPLPYDQRLDAVRTYLEGLGTSRFEAMRAFRKEVACHHLAHAERYPLDEELDREFLGFNEKEYGLLTSHGPSLAQLYGFPGDDDGAVVVQLKELPVFLRHTKLELEEARALIEADKPKWIEIGSEPTAQEWHCNLPTVTRSFGENLEESPETLQRLHRYLRMYRYLRSELGSIGIKGDWKRTTDVCEALNHYTKSAENKIQINKHFLWELASLRHLCDEINALPGNCWVWYGKDERISNVKGGLAFATSASGHRVAELQHGVFNKDGDDLDLVMKLSGLDFSNGGNLPRRALRVVELAKRARSQSKDWGDASTHRLPPAQLRYLFWGEGKDVTPIATPCPDDAFWEMNSKFASGNTMKGGSHEGENGDISAKLIDWGFEDRAATEVVQILKNIIDEPTPNEKRYTVSLEDISDKAKRALKEPFAHGDKV